MPGALLQEVAEERRLVMLSEAKHPRILVNAEILRYAQDDRRKDLFSATCQGVRASAPTFAGARIQGASAPEASSRGDFS